MDTILGWIWFQRHQGRAKYAWEQTRNSYAWLLLLLICTGSWVFQNTGQYVRLNNVSSPKRQPHLISRIWEYCLMWQKEAFVDLIKDFEGFFFFFLRNLNWEIILHYLHGTQMPAQVSLQEGGEIWHTGTRPRAGGSRSWFWRERVAKSQGTQAKKLEKPEKGLLPSTP